MARCAIKRLALVICILPHIAPNGPSALRTLQNIFLALNILSSKELIEGSHPLTENIFGLALAESKKGYTFAPVFETETNEALGVQEDKRFLRLGSEKEMQ